MLQHVSVLNYFLWLNNIPLYKYTIFLNRFTSCLDILAIVNNAAMNIFVQVFVYMYVFSFSWITVFSNGALLTYCLRFKARLCHLLAV